MESLIYGIFCWMSNNCSATGIWQKNKSVLLLVDHFFRSIMLRVPFGLTAPDREKRGVTLVVRAVPVTRFPLPRL
jgi:hypothetical protein